MTLEIVGYCLCNKPIYYDPEERRNRFTCREAPCEMITDAEGEELEEGGLE